MLLAKGFEKAFLGIASRDGQPTVAVYDTNICFKILIENGMDMNEAMDHFYYNVCGGWLGEQTPIFLDKMKLSEAIEIVEE